MKRTAALVATLAGFVVLYGQSAPRLQPQPYTTWSDYAGSADSAQYSALKQINKSNINRLEQAWFHPTPGPNYAFNPVIVDGMMYVYGRNRSFSAIDAATGKEIWNHPLEGGAQDRGINFWQSKDGSDRRLIYSVGSYLQEINARTGVTINTFGKDGKVDLREGLDRDPRSIRGIQSRNPGRVFENLVILGSAPGEGFGSPPGDIRAYNVLTGKMEWIFHSIPRPGEFGHDTWPPEAYKYAGGANTWGELTLDEKRGIVYVPLGSPSGDLYGADRHGNNLYGNSIVAIDARTGKRLWHFQTVHHDLWDYDLTTAPKLLTIKQKGKSIDIVAQAGKTGYLYVFNRVTGEPIWPIEEKPVTKSDVPGEQSSPTQPIPTKPPPFSRVKFSPDEINPHLDPAEQAKLRDILLKAANEGVFTPSSHLRNHIQIPGAFGGSNWGAAATDPTSGMLFIRGYDAPSIRQLNERVQGPRLPANATIEQRGFVAYSQNCQVCHGPDRTNLPAPGKLDTAAFTKTVREGRGQMPSFSTETVNAQTLDAIAAYLNNPSAGVIPPQPQQQQAGGGGGRGGRGGELAPGPARPPGLRNFSGPFGAQWLSSGGLPVIGPPWSELVAYDMNEGTIKWRVPVGNVPALAAKGIVGTGSYRPRTGPVVTAGGVIFLASGGEKMLRAYDKDNGKVIWEKQLEANPDGIPAVYEIGGRQFVVFCVAGDPGGGSRTPAMFSAGKPEAQGYYAYALPTRTSAKK